MPEERTVKKKSLVTSQNENVSLESQERDGWKMLQII